MSCTTDLTPRVRRTRPAKSAASEDAVANPARAESFFTFPPARSMAVATSLAWELAKTMT
jgi:hypothetical protein